jgi:GntR family transcriptional regulator of vanillate catabolism
MTSLDPRSILTSESESHTVRALLELRGMLMRGDFKPGEHIREVPLAERLGVSRTPARLALERLAHEGLLEARPKGGFEVRQFTLQDILDAIEIRGVLESCAARLAALRLSCDEELAPMRACIDDVSALLARAAPTLEMVAAYGPINDRFHGCLIELAKSPILTRSMEQVRALPFASPSTFTSQQAEAASWNEILAVAHWHHRGIVDAIAARDAMRASALALEHSTIALRSVEVALREKRLGTMPGGSLVRIPSGDDDGPLHI